MSETCTVYRKRGKPWVFKPVEGHIGLRYITSRGTEYAVFIEEGDFYQPVWVGRFVPHAKGGPLWFTDGDRLRVTRIVFGNGGEYRFPKRTHHERTATDG